MRKVPPNRLQPVPVQNVKPNLQAVPVQNVQPTFTVPVKQTSNISPKISSNISLETPNLSLLAGSVPKVTGINDQDLENFLTNVPLSIALDDISGKKVIYNGKESDNSRQQSGDAIIKDYIKNRNNPSYIPNLGKYPEFGKLLWENYFIPALKLSVKDMEELLAKYFEKDIDILFKNKIRA